MPALPDRCNGAVDGGGIFGGSHDGSPFPPDDVAKEEPNCGENIDSDQSGNAPTFYIPFMIALIQIQLRTYGDA